MAFFSGENMRAAVKRAGAWLYGLMLRKGWRRWALLAVVLILGILLSSLVFDGVDYSRNPSALVPRSIKLYAETENLDQLLKNVAKWKAWKPELLPTEEQRNPTAVNLAAMIGEQVPGLGIRTPLAWLSAADFAAYGVVEGDAGNPEAWALYLALADPAQAIIDLNIEPGLTVTQLSAGKESAVHRLAGAEGGQLFMSAVHPWLIVSSSQTLPEFAIGSLKSSELTLGRSGLLMDWRRNVVVRGVFDPAYLAQSPAGGSSRLGFTHNWLAPSSRIAFTAKLSGDAGMDVGMSARELSGHIRGGGVWFLLKFIFGIIALICLALAIATVLAMLGRGAWLKFAAVRLGIAPASGPEPVQPSAAFKADSGMNADFHREEVIAVETVVQKPVDAPEETPVQDAEEPTQGNL